MVEIEKSMCEEVVIILVVWNNTCQYIIAKVTTSFTLLHFVLSSVSLYMLSALLRFANVYIFCACLEICSLLQCCNQSFTLVKSLPISSTSCLTAIPELPLTGQEWVGLAVENIFREIISVCIYFKYLYQSRLTSVAIENY